MRNLKKLLSISLFCLVTTLSVAQTISIQSTLKNIGGEAVPDGERIVIFKLYDEAEGGKLLWNETANVEVRSGIFSHELGSVAAIDTVNFGIQLFLGITVNNRELSPRTKFAYAPYAMAVKSLAANGGDAGFDANGKFEVSGDMSVIGASNFGSMTVNGVSNMNGINNIGSIKSSSTIGVGIGNDTPSHGITIGYKDTGITGDIESLNFKVNTMGTNMVLKANGNLGIGTIDPMNHLSIGDPTTGIGGGNNYMDFRVGNSNPNNSIMRLRPSGRVGIGTLDPEATLHVKGTVDNIGIANGGSNNFTYFERGSVVFSSGTPTTNICAYFEQSILADAKVYAGHVANWSDQRVKTNFKKSNSQTDLALLNQIEITDYDHIDKLNNDNRTQKKVIAQQVEKVLPNTISKVTKVIPNVYEVAKGLAYSDGFLTIKTNKVHDFVAGDLIDLITPNKDLDRVEVVKIIDEHTFTIKADEKPENVFVYGKYVNDFLAVDYDAIAMLNVSASQEMYRMIIDLQNQNKKLTQKANELQTENDALKSSSASIEDRLSALELLLAPSDTSKSNRLGNTDK